MVISWNLGWFLVNRSNPVYEAGRRRRVPSRAPFLVLTAAGDDTRREQGNVAIEHRFTLKRGT